MSEENKALFRKFVDECFNRKDPSAIDRLIAPDILDHNLPPGQEPGAESMKQLMGMFFGAFPDLSVTIDQLVAEGDLVVGRMTTAGTHQGDFMGIAATGKSVKFTEMHMVRIVGGKAVEHWGNSDEMTMMQQLGVVPS